MDSDDISLPSRLKKQFEFMEQNPQCNILGTGFEYFGAKTGTVINKNIVKLTDLLHGCFLSHPTVMLRKEFLDKYNLKYDKNYDSAEDYELWTRATKYTHIYNLKTVLLKYRWHDKNISVKKCNTQQEMMSK